MALRSISPPAILLEVKHNVDPQPAESTDLEFLTFTDINQTTDPRTKRKIRSHVQRRVRQNSRGGKRKEKPGEIVLDISSLSQVSAGPSREVTTSISFSQADSSLYDLGAGRSNPFVRYPIEMDIRSHELYNHLHGKTCPLLNSLSRIGFFTMVLDEAAFRQILGMSSSHMTLLRGGTENRETHIREGIQNAESIALSSQAIRSINRRIADPVQRMSDGVLVTILAFTCHAILNSNLQGILTHFNGLVEMIRRRGGLQGLNSNPIMLMTLFWVDIHAAFLLDRSPIFPIPGEVLARVSTHINSLVSFQDMTLLEGCVDDVLLSALNELLMLNQFILSELPRRDMWDKGIFAGLQVLPLLSKFLSIRYEINGRNPEHTRQESRRIGAILYLDGIRRTFHVLLTTGVYLSKLQAALIALEYLNLEMADPKLLWMLVLGGAQSHIHPEHKWFVSVTANVIVRWHINTWDELMNIVRGVLWIDGILSMECDEFHRELSLESSSTYGHIFS